MEVLGLELNIPLQDNIGYWWPRSAIYRQLFIQYLQPILTLNQLINQFLPRNYDGIYRAEMK